MASIYELVKIQELSEKEKQACDRFIMSESTSGEFINSLNYLAYHPKNRFIDDSILVRDIESKTIRGVVVATVDCIDNNTIVSHSGTTFAGPIIDGKLGIDKALEVLDILTSYYEEKYKKIIFKLRPQWYDGQPFGKVEYYLFNHGYTGSQIALANVINIAGINTQEDVLKLFDSKRRNQVKKVIKEDLFHFSVGQDILSDVWVNMNDNLNKRFASHTTHTFEEIIDLKQRCGEHIAPYYVNDSNGNYGAFGLIYKFKNVFHTQYLDVNYEYTNHYPNLLLIMYLILEARKLGYSKFSFGPSTENAGAVINTGLYSYKAGYGGGDIIMPCYTKIIGS